MPAEHIFDPVNSKLDDIEMVTQRAQDALRQHQEAEQVNRQSLFGQRQQLLQDLKDKVSAHTIDQSCLMKVSVPRGAPKARFQEGRFIGAQTARPFMLPT